MTSLVAQTGKASIYNVGDLGLILGSGRSLEKEMATHCSTLASKIPWTEEPGVHGDAKSWTQLSDDFTFTFILHWRWILYQLSYQGSPPPYVTI